MSGESRSSKAEKEEDKGKGWDCERKGGKTGERGEMVGGLFFGAVGIRNVRRARYLLASFLDSNTRGFHDTVTRVYEPMCVCVCVRVCACTGASEYASAQDDTSSRLV